MPANASRYVSMSAMTQAGAPLEQLRCRGPEGWIPLPAWARFMLSAGAAAARFSSDEGRLVIALSVPTRSFAAALAGAAAVVTSFRESTPAGGAAEHFEQLASLPAGTPVHHRDGDSIEQGLLMGVADDFSDSRPRLKVELPKERTVYLPEGLCKRIQVISHPETLTTRKRKLVKTPEFLSRALTGIDVQSLSSTTELDCVIVGVKRALEYELIQERFAAGEASECYEGTLQEIVRARPFAVTNAPHRSDVMSASADAEDSHLAELNPAVTIFDGAAAFDNWRVEWRSSNRLVIIDRSSPSAGDGAATINQAYASRIRECDALEDVDVPRGIEMVTYLEHR